MDQGELEGIAIHVYERHDFDPGRPLSTIRLARAELGDNAVKCLSTMGSRRRGIADIQRREIGVNFSLAPQELNHVCGHELAHVLLAGRIIDRTEEEDACDRLGACLMAPLPAMAHLYRVHGWDVAAIAHAVCATQTWAALRLSETTRVPLISVSPGGVRARGPEEWTWGSESQVRRWARHGRPGLRKVQITDRPGCVALVAND